MGGDPGPGNGYIRDKSFHMRVNAMMGDSYHEVLPRNLLMFGTGGVGSGGGGSPGGDYPIRNKNLLPAKPSSRGIYDILQDFIGGVQNAYELGVQPPQAPTVEDMMRWRAQTSPWAEEQILQKTNPQQLFKTRKETVGI